MSTTIQQQAATAERAPQQRSAAFTAFWLYQADRGRLSLDAEGRVAAIADLAGTIEAAAPHVELRAAYATAGLSAGVDLILWVVADDMAPVHDLAVAISRSPAGHALSAKHAYIGTASASQYDPNHGPAFLRGLAPKRYLSVYPFTKTPAWYLLPFEERRRLMVEHGQMGTEFPSILTNTVSSFGIADQEFIVALEDDDPGTLVAMVQRLRAAAVREYTQVDTPIFLGLRKPLADALAAAL